MAGRPDGFWLYKTALGLSGCMKLGILPRCCKTVNHTLFSVSGLFKEGHVIEKETVSENKTQFHLQLTTYKHKIFSLETHIVGKPKRSAKC